MRRAAPPFRGAALSAVLAFLVASLSFPVFSQSLPETEFGEPWNAVGVGVRAIGMGGAYTALSDDLSGVYWNPAGLVQMSDTQASIMTGSPYWERDAGDFSHNWGMLGFVTSAFKPWVAGVTAVRNFHSESLVPWQENLYIFTFVVPNAARTGALGLNVKYMRSDSLYASPLPADPVLYQDTTFSLLDREGHMFDSFSTVTGWSADLGVHYSIPLHVRDRYRQANFGFSIRNALGQAETEQRSRPWPPQIQTGAAWIFDDLVPREKSIFSLNFDFALSSKLGRESSQFRMGFEQWFLGNTGAVRIGYASPLPLYEMKEVAAGYFYQGRPVLSVGGTLRGTSPAMRTVLGLGLGNLADGAQLDVAFTLPVERRVTRALPGAPENFYIRQSNPNGILPVDATRFYMQVTWRWMTAGASPYARVSVEPLVFSPRRGETAIFSVETRDRQGIDSWELVIRNSARVPVRSFAGNGVPPGRIEWDGLDARFNVVPDDDHTYQLRIRNRDGLEAVTEPQRLKVFTPGDGKGKTGDPTLIYRILEDNAQREKAAQAEMDPLIRDQLDQMKAPLGGEDAWGSTAYGEGWLPYGPAPAATLAETAAPSSTSHVSFRGLEPGQVVRFDVPVQGDAAVLEYETRQYIFRFLAREIRRLTEESFRAVGTGVERFLVQARYGDRVLTVETPMPVARALAAGRVDERRWLQASTVTLDGNRIEPMVE